MAKKITESASEWIAQNKLAYDKLVDLFAERKSKGKGLSSSYVRIYVREVLEAPCPSEYFKSIIEILEAENPHLKGVYGKRKSV